MNISLPDIKISLTNIIKDVPKDNLENVVNVLEKVIDVDNTNEKKDKDEDLNGNLSETKPGVEDINKDIQKDLVKIVKFTDKEINEPAGFDLYNNKIFQDLVLEVNELKKENEIFKKELQHFQSNILTIAEIIEKNSTQIYNMNRSFRMNRVNF